MRWRWLVALMLFGACAPFAADPEAGTPDVDPDVEPPPPGPPGADGGLPEDGGAAFCLTRDADLACEDFERTTFREGWTQSNTDAGRMFERLASPDPLQRGVGRVFIDETKTWNPEEQWGADLITHRVSVQLDRREIITLAFAFRIVALPSLAVEIAKLEPPNPANDDPLYNVHLKVTRANGVVQLVLGQYDGFTYEQMGEDLVVAGVVSEEEWHRGELRLATGGAGQKNAFEARFEGTSTGVQPVATAHAFTTTQTVKAAVGLTYTAANAGLVDVWLDDVSVTRELPAPP